MKSARGLIDIAILCTQIYVAIYLQNFMAFHKLKTPLVISFTTLLDYFKGKQSMVHIAIYIYIYMQILSNKTTSYALL